MAVRFNLKITHVYRGLLLGTGPLVDPGFTGKLSLPLHNLTTNDYEIAAGEGLIWMEFTKLSPDPHRELRNEPPAPRVGEVVALPPSKKNQDVHDYLAKASPHRPVRSSIPEAAEAGERAVRQLQRLTQFGIAAIIVGVITTLGVLFAAYGVVRDANEALDQQRRDILELQAEVDDLNE